MTSTAPFTRLSSSLMPNETAICWPTIELLLSRHTGPNDDAEARGSATRPRDEGAIQAVGPHPMALAGDPPPWRTAGRDAVQPDVSSPPIAVLGWRLPWTKRHQNPRR